MANIASQEKRITRAERERLENRRHTSQVKTYFRRLEDAVEAGDAARADRSTASWSRGSTAPSSGRAAPRQRRPQEGAAPRAPRAPVTIPAQGHRRFAAGCARDGLRLRTLSRREFLERTAYGAGLAGMAAGLPAGTLLAEAAERRPPPCPDATSPRNIEIDHFVILMMENRSFDHYFGWLPDADGSQRQSYRAPDGQIVPTRHFSTLGTGGVQYKGCGHPDPGHGWDAGRAQLKGGFMADGRRQRRVRPHLLQPGRARLHPRGGAQVHAVRPLLLLAPRLDLAEQLLQVVRAVGRPQEQHAAVRDGGNHGRRSSTAPRPRPQRSLLQLGPPFAAVVGAARRGLDQPDRRATTRTAPPERCRTSPSSIRRSRTAAAATASPPTSTRSATPGSGRRSWPTSSTPS